MTCQTFYGGPHYIFKSLKGQLELLLLINIIYYYMALSYTDWELPNSRIWLAELDIDRGLDFPI